MRRPTSGEQPEIGIARGIGTKEVDVLRFPEFAELQCQAGAAAEKETVTRECLPVEPGQDSRDVPMTFTLEHRGRFRTVSPEPG